MFILVLLLCKPEFCNKGTQFFPLTLWRIGRRTLDFLNIRTERGGVAIASPAPITTVVTEASRCEHATRLLHRLKTPFH